MSGDAAQRIVDELKRDPKRFRATHGYERLLNALREEHSCESVSELLRGEADVVGDVLWTICQLQRVEPYVSDALRHIHTRDVGTAAYAIEVVLRGSRDGHQLMQVLDRLVSHQDPVLEHAIRTLAGEGLVRLRDILEAAGWSWAIAIVDEAGHRSLPRDTIEELIFDMRRERQIIGFVLATLASETSGWAVQVLKRSEDAWVRDYADWLTELFEHSWPR